MSPANKRKLTGRIVYAINLSDSQVYWTCPNRGCKDIHCFSFIFPKQGASPIYQKLCNECEKAYKSEQIKVSGSAAILIVTFDEEEE